MAGFKYKGQVKGGLQSPGTMDLIIGNSETIYVGSAVELSSGYVGAAETGDKILGIVMGIVNKDGIDLDSCNSNTYDGTWTPGVNGAANYAATSDNATDKQIKAVVCVDKDAIWEAACTGLAAAQRFGFFDLTDSVNVTAYQGNGMNAGQLQLIDFDSSTLGYFKIAESALDAYTVS